MPAVPAPVPTNEAQRLAALHRLRVLDTLPEQVYDDIVHLASQICGTPIGLVSLIDGERQWFKARVGLAAIETHRDAAFCAHAIAGREPMLIVEDAALDARFGDNPLVIGDPHIRFYAGAPIVTTDGHALGTVCVIDTEPRRLSASQARSLQALARQATALLELRLRTIVSEEQAQALERISAEAGEERRRSAEMLDLVLRGGNLGLWDLHVPTGRFNASPRECEMLGFDPGTVRDLAWRKLVHPDDKEVVDRAILPHLAGDTAYYQMEHRMRHRNGQWIWVLSHAVIAERKADGSPLRIVGTHLDVTTRITNRLALQQAQDLLRRMGALAKVGGWELDIETGERSWTEEMYRIHELDPAAPLTKGTSVDYYPPESRPAIQAAVDAALADGTPWDLELPFVTSTGRALTVRAQGQAVKVAGRVVRMFGTFQDVTERRLAEQALVDSQRRLRLITDNLPATVAHIDHEQRYRFLNGHIRRTYGTDIEAALGRTMREVRGDAVYERLRPHVEAALRGERASFLYVENVDGRVLQHQSNYIPDIDDAGRVQGFYAMTFDVTELRETQDRLEQLARIDSLTGLPNRRQFDERIADGMARARRLGRSMAVMFLDIDHFKSINDSLGHAGGDAVLREFARRLLDSVRITDTVARLAGDEFVLLLEGMTSLADLDALADKVVASIRPAFDVAGNARAITTSAGIAVYDGSAIDAPGLLAQADRALYRAKQTGRDRYVIA
jgi:diguanylate cyclase (GGDEF)-like protein/PAS domain S-box-containing protein